jgi:hypothetical protein
MDTAGGNQERGILEGAQAIKSEEGGLEQSSLPDEMRRSPVGEGHEWEGTQ